MVGCVLESSAVVPRDHHLAALSRWVARLVLARSSFGGRTRAANASNSSSGNSRRYCSTPSSRYSIAVIGRSFPIPRVLKYGVPGEHPPTTDAFAVEVGVNISNPTGRAAEYLRGFNCADKVITQLFCNTVRLTSVDGSDEAVF